MKTINDILGSLKNLDDKELENIHSVIKYYRRKALQDKLYDLYLEKVKRQIDFINAALFILINQVYNDNHNDGIKKFAISMAEVSKKYLSEFCADGNRCSINFTDLLEYFNYFVICSEVKTTIRRRDKLQINLRKCQFGYSKIFCDFTYNFLLDFFASIYPDKIVHIDKGFSGRKNRNCSFVIKIEDFKYIKILRLE